MMVMVRLTRKLADRLDGVDLSNRSVGDVFEMPASEARLLLAERWAVPIEPGPADVHSGTPGFAAPTANGEVIES